MMLVELVEFLSLKIRKRSIKIDKRIPDGYLFVFVLSKAFMLVNGFLKFRRLSVMLVGKRVTLKARSLIYGGKGLVVDDGCYIDALAVKGITFGRGVSLKKNVTIECTGSLTKLGVGLSIGNNVGIGSGSFLGCAGGISIGDDTIIGNYVSFHSENHNFSDLATPIRLQGVNSAGIQIGNNCWLGAKVTVLDGVILEDGCIVAAGTVLKAGRYASNAIYAGVPAKQIKERS
ncbi:DapH/DapD/GlmU-related protein [Pseudomonas sp. W4I3]|uniref:acyltransferase n=1 Tax=Pseudomonas sp. W4I3 TaxID=3042294 RepID=UPI00277FF208|nr:DapH/DapD/GlmU-related protein [Pseudomonas sp. W4I3]MDQ0739332.1 acetyltransferase-like isoleucine patch superfamily enzyme [Pseudomonas sp. W4I3]